VAVKRKKRRYGLEARAKKKIMMSATLMGVFGSCEVYDVGTDSYSFVSFASNVTGACPDGEPKACEDLLPIFAGFFAVAVLASLGSLYLRVYLIRQSVADYRHGISVTVSATAAAATGTADDVDVRLSLIKQKRLEAKAALALSVCEDIPMGGIAMYRIQKIDGGSMSSTMVLVSSALCVVFRGAPAAFVVIACF